MSQQLTECESISSGIVSAQNNIENLKVSTSGIDNSLTSAENDLENKQRKFDDLQKQLEMARVARDDAAKLVNSLKTEKAAIGPKTVALINQLNNLTAQKANC